MQSTIVLPIPPINVFFLQQTTTHSHFIFLCVCACVCLYAWMLSFLSLALAPFDNWVVSTSHQHLSLSLSLIFLFPKCNKQTHTPSLSLADEFSSLLTFYSFILPPCSFPSLLFCPVSTLANFCWDYYFFFLIQVSFCRVLWLLPTTVNLYSLFFSRSRAISNNSLLNS